MRPYNKRAMLAGKFVKLYNKGISIRGIARKYSCDKNDVKRWLKHSGVVIPVPKRNTLDDFKNHVVKNKTGCWGWTASINNKEYGQISINGKLELAHRISYTIYKANPKNKSVLHKCDNPICTNPEHLFIGSAKDNMRDKIIKGRSPQIKYTPDIIRSVREMVKSGITLKDISVIHNIKIKYLYKIKNREVWDFLK